jgi:two-component system chemotaxis response regulator CheB
MRPIRVLVVDDSAFMRAALVRMIEKEVAFQVVGVAATGEDAVEKARTLKPDVMTLDVDMPGMGGLAALRKIVAETGTPVIMVSAATDADAMVTMEALAAGAVDFVPKAFEDRERNIFRGIESLHDKLFAAVEVGRQRRVGREPLYAPLPKPMVARVMVIGSSTGGPCALEAVLQGWKPPVAVVLAQHMPPLFTAAMARRLDGLSVAEVVEARDGDRLCAGKVLVAPGGLQMRVVEGGEVRVEKGGEGLYRPSVDVLAESVAQVYGGAAVGVMLTGMGSDGLRGFSSLKHKGARIVVQDQSSSVVYGMPKAVVDAGLADAEVALGEMQGYLQAVLGEAKTGEASGRLLGSEGNAEARLR